MGKYHEKERRISHLDRKLKKMIFLGDSITDAGRFYDKEGLGHGYVRLLADHLGEHAHLINRGKDGFTAYQIDRYLAMDCLEQKPDAVSILVGVNDLIGTLNGAGGYDAREYGRILRHILTRIQDSGTRHILVMEPFLFPEPEEYRQLLPLCKEFAVETHRSAQENGALYLPLQKIFARELQQRPAQTLTTDGVHLTSLGHRILADHWLTLMKSS